MPLFGILWIGIKFDGQIYVDKYQIYSRQQIYKHLLLNVCSGDGNILCSHSAAAIPFKGKVFLCGNNMKCSGAKEIQKATGALIASTACQRRGVLGRSLLDCITGLGRAPDKLTVVSCLSLSVPSEWVFSLNGIYLTILLNNF